MVTPEDRAWAIYEDRYRATLDAISFAVVHQATGYCEALVVQIHRCQELLQQPKTPEYKLRELRKPELQHLAESLLQQLASSSRPPKDTA
jgi:hypothetical protein